MDINNKPYKIASLENALIFFQTLMTHTFDKSNQFILSKTKIKSWVQTNPKKSKICLWMLPSTPKNFEMQIKLGENLKLFLNINEDIEWSTTHKIDVTGDLESKKMQYFTKQKMHR